MSSEEHIVHKLISNKILKQNKNNSLLLSDSFRSKLEKMKSSKLNIRKEAKNALSKNPPSSDISNDFIRACPSDFLMELICIYEQLPSKNLNFELAQGTILIDSLYHSVASEGTPNSFLPVRGILIPVLLQMHGKSIIYLWRKNCPPCNQMRTNLEQLDSGSLSAFSLFSVYGPEDSEMLQEYYDVSGGPTVLFSSGNKIDTRLVGVYNKKSIMKEICKIDNQISN